MHQSSSTSRNGFGHGRSRLNTNGSETEAERQIREIHNFAEMEFKHGKSLAAREDFSQAITHLQKASDLVNHKNATYLIELAQAHEHLEEFDKAFETYSRALWLKPPQVMMLHFHRGLVAARQGKYESAVDDFGRVINTFAGTVPPQPDLRKQLAATFYHRGLVQQKRQRIQPAIEDIERALELDPQMADALFTLGSLRGQTGEHDKAVQAFERALQVVDSFDDARTPRRYYTYHRGLAHLRNGNHAAAIVDFTTVLNPPTSLQLSSTDDLAIDAIFHRGTAHLAQQSLLAAIEDFTQVLSIDGHHIEAFRLRSEAYAANGQLEQAESDVMNVLNRKPDFAASFFQRAITKLSSSPLEAIADLTEAIRLRAEFPEAYYHRGLLRQKIATEIEGAIADFKQTLSQQPDHEFARYQLGKTYEQAGKHKLAIDQYTQMLNDGLNKYPFVYLARSRCYRELGDRVQATSDLRKAKKLEVGAR